MKLRLELVILIVTVVGTVGLAQSTAPASQPAQTPLSKLTIHGVLASGSWPQYRLIPSVLDLEPGDAVPFYLMSEEGWPDQKTTNEVLEPENHKYDYLDTPIDQFPKEHAKKLLDAYGVMLMYAELGARRREAHWDAIWDVDQEQPVVKQHGAFHYTNSLRHVENLLSFRSRFEMSQKDYPAALHTVQNMFSIARHMGSENLLIHKLVEASFTELTLAVALEEWVGRADSPNLYWPLTNLPRPFVTTNMYGYYDDAMSQKWQPLLVQAVRGNVPPEKWPLVLREVVVRGLQPRPPEKIEKATMDAEVKRLVDGTYDAALRARTDVGAGPTTRERIVGQYLIRQYTDAADRLWKAFGLPFPEARDEMLRVWKEVAPQKAPASENPLIRSDLVSTGDPYPNPLRYRYYFERVDRYVALLRVIEALRDYAAGHDGMPPAKLEDVKGLPVPADPMTGRAFGYEVKGNVVMLDATPPKPFGVFGGWRYELTFVK